MNVKRKVALSLAALAVGGLTIVPASAASARTDTGVTAASVPTCVWTKSLGARKVRVTNKCPRAVRVKVIVARRGDKACWSYRPGASKEWSWGRPGRFDGLRYC
ncbi:hypothetical protein ACFY19_04265 [Streptosporangium saharense]|uniref:hypothetical protein n=1 Tax=Streptosporangium saharense TaxID=1706840 RepID=UPI0036AD8084